MKVGIDSYCYHRFMGGAYPDLERDPGFRLTVFDVLARARALGVDGVSIEACFLPAIDVPLLERLAATLADYRYGRGVIRTACRPAPIPRLPTISCAISAMRARSAPA